MKTGERERERERKHQSYNKYNGWKSNNVNIMSLSMPLT